MASLEHPGLFVPTGTGVDKGFWELSDDSSAQGVLLHRVMQLWDLDLDKVQISGKVNDYGPSKPDAESFVSVSIKDASGEIFTDSILYSMYNGWFHVQAKPGVEREEVIRRNLGKELREAWFRILGYPENYPSATEIEVGRFGSLTITVDPLT